jgi:hypothetical protein
MRIRDPSRPTAALAVLALIVALGVGCPGDTNPRINYVTFYLAAEEAYYHVPWRAEDPFPLDPPCVGYETDLVGRAVQAGEQTDTGDQGEDTYFRYVGDEDGVAAGGCSGSFEAHFDFFSTRYHLEGQIARPFPDVSAVDESDPDPHATGTYTIEGQVGSAAFTFWAYEYDPPAP